MDGAEGTVARVFRKQKLHILVIALCHHLGENNEGDGGFKDSDKGLGMMVSSQRCGMLKRELIEALYFGGDGRRSRLNPNSNIHQSVQIFLSY